MHAQYSQASSTMPHSYLQTSNNLSILSYVVVQQLKRIHLNKFTAIIYEDDNQMAFHHLSSGRILENLAYYDPAETFSQEDDIITIPRKMVSRYEALASNQRLLEAASRSLDRGILKLPKEDLEEVVAEGPRGGPRGSSS